MKMPSRRRAARFLVVVTMIIMAAYPMTSQSFSTIGHWGSGADFLTYRINTNLGNELPGLGGQQAAIEARIKSAAGEWTKASWFSFSHVTGNCDFPTKGCFDADNLNNVNLLAVTNWTVTASRQLTNAYVKFNTQRNWTLDGAEPAILQVSMHEFGHMLSLYDDPVETWQNNDQQSIMWYRGSTSALYIDDKEALTMMYGIWTQFEVSQFLGLYQTLPYYAQSVHSFGNCGTGYPDYWVVNPPTVSPNGGRAMEFKGCADNNGTSPNYAYMPLALDQHDGQGRDLVGPQPACGNSATACYLKIQANTVLSWQQYNATKCTVSIDLEFTDGTTLRDSGLTDASGVSVHPAQRTCKTGWFIVSVNLGSLAGKTVKRWLIAYDSPNTSGTWRTYIDDLKVTY